MEIRPNELSDPGERAAWARVEALFEHLDALEQSALVLSLRRSLTEAEHDDLLDRAEELVDGLGRGDLLDAATDHLEAALSARLSSPVYRYMPGYVPSTGRPEDIAAIIGAMRDLLLATVVEDRLARDDVDRLGADGRLVLGLDAGGGQLPASPAPTGVIIEEPSEADWADAAAGPTAVDPDASVIGSRRTVAAGLWGMGIVAAVGLLAIGFSGGNPALGIGGAVVALLVAGSLANRR